MGIALRIIRTQDLKHYKRVQLRAAQLEMRRIKDYHDKAKHQAVTNVEAAEYYGIPLELFEAAFITTD